MQIRIEVRGSEGRLTVYEANVAKEGELAAAVSAAINTYRGHYPEAPSFDYTIAVSHA